MSVKMAREDSDDDGNLRQLLQKMQQKMGKQHLLRQAVMCRHSPQLPPRPYACLLITWFEKLIGRHYGKGLEDFGMDNGQVGDSLVFEVKRYNKAALEQAHDNAGNDKEMTTLRSVFEAISDPAFEGASFQGDRVFTASRLRL